MLRKILCWSIPWSFLLSLNGCKLAAVDYSISADGVAPGPFSGKKFWRDPNSNPARHPELANIAPHPMGLWITGEDAISGISNAMNQAAGQIPVIVLYNFPGRDCGQASAGGAKAITDYDGFVERSGAAIGGNEAIVILEPDALALDKPGCNLGDGATTDLGRAVSTLKKAAPKAHIYIDIGNDDDYPPFAKAVDRLIKAKIAEADGFSLNVSNFVDTPYLVQRGQKIAAAIKEKTGKEPHFVIDSSRNGNGGEKPKNEWSWCNPKGQALGIAPTGDTGQALLDAFLWIKIVGESDGPCNRGEPGAGSWFDQYANDLNKNPPKTIEETMKAGAASPQTSANVAATTSTAAASNTPQMPPPDSEGLVGTALLEGIRNIIGADPRLPRNEVESKPFMGSFANIKSKDDPNFAVTGYCMTDDHCGGHMEAYSRPDVPLSDLKCNKFCFIDKDTKKYKPSTKYTTDNPPKHYLCCGWETCN